MDDGLNVIVLTDEDGIEREFEVVTKLEIEENEYFIVAPTDDEDADAIALKVEKNDNGEEVLVVVEDDEEFEMIQEAYDTLMSDGLLN